MDIKKSTQDYETWLAEKIPLIEADLRLKHLRMAEDKFLFLRASFYRWAQLWPKLCPELNTAPAVLAVGDLHVANFGTWRDREGRLTWGVNDFDEAYRIAYTNDLVRLSVSAALAVSKNPMSVDTADICSAVLSGYQEGLEQGGQPFVLSDRHRWLWDLATSDFRNPILYWENLEKLPTVRNPLPPLVSAALKKALPENKLPFRVVHRQAGLGSLGRRRFTALAQWQGGKIAREAKELAMSAWIWESGKGKKNPLCYQEIVDHAVRVPDPLSGIHQQWVIRRLAPDCSRIELRTLPHLKDELRLLRAMGWETANIHLGSKAAVRKVLADLKKRPAKWLRTAVDTMLKATIQDWKDWKAA